MTELIDASPKYITILDVALAEGAKQDERGAINMGEFERLGLPFFCGCENCNASLAPYNAYPSKTGFIHCKECIQCEGWDDMGIGFETVPEFQTWQTQYEDGPKHNE